MDYVLISGKLQKVKLSAVNLGEDFLSTQVIGIGYYKFNLIIVFFAS